MAILQGPGQLRHCIGRTQDGRNNGTFPLHELAEKRLNLLVLPGADTPVTDKNRCRLYAVDLLSEFRLPRGTGRDLLYVKPRLDALLDQLLSDLADGWLVLAIVAQEHIKDFSVGAVHSLRS